MQETFRTFRFIEHASIRETVAYLSVVGSWLMGALPQALSVSYQDSGPTKASVPTNRRTRVTRQYREGPTGHQHRSTFTLAATRKTNPRTEVSGRNRSLASLPLELLPGFRLDDGKPLLPTGWMVHVVTKSTGTLADFTPLRATYRSPVRIFTRCHLLVFIRC